MKSSNPIFSRSEGFNGRASTQYSDPSRQHIDLSGHGGYSSTQMPGAPTPVSPGRMTLDSVIEKTAITLGLVVLSAAVTWFMLGDLSQPGALGLTWTLAMGGAIVGFVLAMVVSFRKRIKPGFVLAYAVVEGVFIGAFSKAIAVAFVGDTTIVFQAVIATMVAFGVTLGAYKYFNIQVTAKFRRGISIAMFAFLGVVLVNFVLSLTGVLEGGGLRGFNGLGLIVSIIAVGLAVMMLILDFDYIEKGIAAGLPEEESWRAAFGLAVTLIWMYIEILRILAILRD